jgi:DNA-binding NarL/FixJ family response regulator
VQVAPNGLASTKAIRLVLAGRHPLTLCGLSQVFEKEADCAILAVCTEPQEVVETVRRHQPDIVIIDLDRHSAFKVLRRMQRARMAAGVVLLASDSDDQDMAEAIRLGARAVVLKELPAAAFVDSIRKVHAGERPALEGNGASRLVSQLFKTGSSMRQGAHQLTPREAEIARLAVMGIPTRDIATRLNVKQGTVKIHLHSIYEKLNVAGRLGLILVARRHGLA